MVGRKAGTQQDKKEGDKVAVGINVTQLLPMSARRVDQGRLGTFKIPPMTAA